MISVRRSDARGQGDRGWLKSHFTFSFADYHDPAFMGFRSLKVMNEDRVAPGKGFGPHAHRDMEIITFVLEGRLAHRDSMSGPHIVGPNEIQTMSAGTGVVHSEFNASEAEPVHDSGGHRFNERRRLSGTGTAWHRAIVADVCRIFKPRRCGWIRLESTNRKGRQA